MKRKCIICRKAFRIKPKRYKSCRVVYTSVRVTCSRKCWNVLNSKRQRIPKNKHGVATHCPMCGNTFRVYPGVFKYRKTGTVCCSRTCSALLRSVFAPIVVSKNFKQLRTCKICKVNYRKIENEGSTSLFCSVDCLNVHRYNLAKDTALQRRRRIKFVCKQCKCIFEKRPSDPKIYCSPKCYVKRTCLSPNLAETKLLVLIKPLGFKYVGDRSLIIGRKNPDFVHNKLPLIIEFFGEYWHSIPDVFSKRYYFNKYGYKCLVVWQKQLNKSPQRVVNRVKAFISKAA